MKLIYATGFSKNEKLEWKPVVFNNIVQSFRMIHDAMKEFSIPFEKPESEVRDHPESPCPMLAFWARSDCDPDADPIATAERHGASIGRP